MHYERRLKIIRSELWGQNMCFKLSNADTRNICLRTARISLQIAIVTDYFIIIANEKNRSRMILEGAHGWLYELDGGMYANVLTGGHKKRSQQK